MSASITNDADKMLCALYKAYLSRRNCGFSKADSRHFSETYFHANKPFSHMEIEDVYDTMSELYKANYLEMDLDANCWLTDSAIIYLENRFKNGLADVLSFLAQFIP